MQRLGRGGEAELASSVAHAHDQIGGAGYFKVYENLAGTLSTTPVWYSNNGGYGSHVSWGDADFDGDLDLVTGRWWERLRIYENVGGTLTTTPTWKSETLSVIENVFWGDVDNADLRADGVSMASGDGARTYVKLGATPVRSVDQVLVNGSVLPTTDFVAHLGTDPLPQELVRPMFDEAQFWARRVDAIRTGALTRQRIACFKPNPLASG